MGTYFSHLIGEGNEILILAVLIILGLFFARLAKMIKFPQISGYILAGIVIGDPLLHLITKQNFDNLYNIDLVALGLMSITIGAHLNFHKLKNSGRRVITVLILESLFSFLFVFTALHFLTHNTVLISLLIASISIATAPAATVAMVKETKSKGLLVNTLMPVVAFNNVLCIVVFGVVSEMIGSTSSAGLLATFTVFGKQLLIAVIIGTVLGYLLKFFAEKNITSSSQVLTFVLLTVLLTTGLSVMLKINSMLPAMVIGIVITNTSRYRATILSIFEEIEYVIMIIFFALAGAHIDISQIGAAGLIGLIYFLARALGKISGGTLGGYIARAPKKVKNFIGFSLLPQAGVAIGLVIMAGSIPALEPHVNFLTTLVLAVVALNELLGPPVTKWALTKSGDAGQDRPKLIEFLQEEYMNPNLKAETKDEAIREMVNFFIRSHGETKELEQEILTSVFDREEEASTGIGNGVAIPHGIVNEGPIICGALGLSQRGIDFNSIDDKPVHLIVLIVTPRNHKADMHLIVLGQLAKILSEGNTLENIISAGSAAEICEILAEQEKKNYNYFLDD